MTRLLHMSDLHFGRPHRAVAADAAQRAVAEHSPDAVIVSGDIVQWAESEIGYRQAREFLERVPAPTLVSPGNHDIARLDMWARLTNPLQHYKRYLRGTRDEVLVTDTATIVGLGTPRWWTPELGYITEKQLDWAEGVLRRQPKSHLRVVVMHHGLRQTTWSPRRDCVRGRRRAERRLRAMGVDLVLSGHNHFGHIQRLGERLLWVQTGTTSSRRFPWFKPRKNTMTLIEAAEAIRVDWLILNEDTLRFERRAGGVFPRQSL